MKFESKVPKTYNGEKHTRPVYMPDDFYNELWLRCPSRGVYTEVVTHFLVLFIKELKKEIPEQQYDLTNARKIKNILSRTTILPADEYQRRDNGSDVGRRVAKFCGRAGQESEVSPDEQESQYPRDEEA